MSNESSYMKWSIGEARRRLSDVIRSAAREPQPVYNRGRMVGVVVAPEEFEEFRQWKAARASRSLADAFSELRELCRREDYVLEIPERRDRPTPFVSERD